MDEPVTLMNPSGSPPVHVRVGGVEARTLSATWSMLVHTRFCASRVMDVLKWPILGPPAPLSKVNVPPEAGIHEAWEPGMVYKGPTPGRSVLRNGTLRPDGGESVTVPGARCWRPVIGVGRFGTNKLHPPIDTWVPSPEAVRNSLDICAKKAPALFEGTPLVEKLVVLLRFMNPMLKFPFSEEALDNGGRQAVHVGTTPAGGGDRYRDEVADHASALHHDGCRAAGSAGGYDNVELVQTRIL